MFILINNFCEKLSEINRCVYCGIFFSNDGEIFVNFSFFFGVAFVERTLVEMNFMFAVKSEEKAKRTEVFDISHVMTNIL